MRHNSLFDTLSSSVPHQHTQPPILAPPLASLRSSLSSSSRFPSLSRSPKPRSHADQEAQLGRLVWLARAPAPAARGRRRGRLRAVLVRVGVGWGASRAVSLSPFDSHKPATPTTQHTHKPNNSEKVRLCGARARLDIAAAAASPSLSFLNSLHNPNKKQTNKKQTKKDLPQRNQLARHARARQARRRGARRPAPLQDRAAGQGLPREARRPRGLFALCVCVLFWGGGGGV